MVELSVSISNVVSSDIEATGTWTTLGVEL